MKPEAPVGYNDFDTISDALALLLQGLIASQSHKPFSPTVFDGPCSRPPSISLKDFACRIERYSGCTPATIVSALVYLDRLLVTHPFLRLTETNAHRIIWTCIVVAIKHFEDNFFTNAHYSKVGGVTLPEMNKLELTLLLSLSFELFITPTQFKQYSDALNSSREYCRMYAAQQKNAAWVCQSPVACVTSATTSMGGSGHF